MIFLENFNSKKCKSLVLKILWMTLCGVILHLLSAGIVTASTFESFGIGSRASAMGNAFTGVADDFSSTYHNPAGIARSRGSLTVSYLLGDPHLWIRDADSQMEYEVLERTEGISLAAVIPIGKLFNIEDLKLGFSLYTPLNFII